MCAWAETSRSPAALVGAVWRAGVEGRLLGEGAGVDPPVHLGGRYLQSSGSFTEESPLDPSSPYSATKAAGDLLVSAHHHTYGLETVICRGSNNYGPRQYPEKLIPLMARAKSST